MSTLVSGWRFRVAWFGVLMVVGPLAVKALLARIDTLAATRADLTRAELRVQESSIVERDAELVRARLEGLVTHLVSDPGDGTAAREVQTLLESAARRSRVSVLATDHPSDSVRLGRFRRLTTRIRCESDFAGIVALLGRIDQSPQLRVVRFTITKSAVASDPDPEVLGAELTVTAWMVAAAADTSSLYVEGQSQ